jgi:hypothetical protein
MANVLIAMPDTVRAVFYLLGWQLASCLKSRNVSSRTPIERNRVLELF